MAEEDDLLIQRRRRAQAIILAKGGSTASPEAPSGGDDLNLLSDLARGPGLKQARSYGVVEPTQTQAVAPTAPLFPENKNAWAQDYAKNSALDLLDAAQRAGDAPLALLQLDPERAKKIISTKGATLGATSKGGEVYRALDEAASMVNPLALLNMGGMGAPAKAAKMGLSTAEMDAIERVTTALKSGKPVTVTIPEGTGSVTRVTPAGDITVNIGGKSVDTTLSEVLSKQLAQEKEALALGLVEDEAKSAAFIAETEKKLKGATEGVSTPPAAKFYGDFGDDPVAAAAEAPGALPSPKPNIGGGEPPIPPKAPPVAVPSPDDAGAAISKIATPARTLSQQAGDIPSKVMGALNAFTKRLVVDPMMDSIEGALVTINKKEAIANLAKSDAALAGDETSHLFRNLETSQTLHRTEEAAGRVQIDHVLGKAGVAPNSPEEWRWTRAMGGEFGDFRKPLSGFDDDIRTTLQPHFESIQSEIARGVKNEIVSPENAKEHVNGLMRRIMQGREEEIAAKTAPRRYTLHEQFMRDDSEGLIVDASKDDVAAALKAIAPDLDQTKLPYFHQIEDSTGIKIGSGPEAIKIRNALKAEFPDKDIVRVVRELSIEERASLKELTNTGSVFQETLESLAKQNEVAEFLNDLSAQTSIMVEKNGIIPDGYTVMPKDKKLGGLSGKIIPTPIAEFINARNAQLPEALDFAVGWLEGVKEALVVTPTGVIRNPTTNVLIYSIAGRVHPILNPEAWGAWRKSWREVHALTQDQGLLSRIVLGKTDLKAGSISETLRMALEDGAVNTAGITQHLTDGYDEALRVMDGVRSGKVTARDAGRKMARALGASPFMELEGNQAIKALKRGAIGAVSEAVPEVLKMAAGVSTGEGAVVRMGARALETAGMGAAAKSLRGMFDAADPIYQLTVYRNALDRGLSRAEATQLVFDSSQNFRTGDMPRSVNLLGGRLPPKEAVRVPGTSLSIPPQAVQMAAKFGGPSFPGFIWNHGKIIGKAAKDQPVAAMLMLGMMEMARRATWRKAKGVMGWDDATLEKKMAEFPTSSPRFSKNKDGSTEVTMIDMTPFAPGITPFYNPVVDQPFSGIAVTTAQRAMAVAGAARSGDTKAVDARTGMNVLQPGERAAPWSALPRVLQESMGGGYSPSGYVWKGIDAAAKGEVDAFGRPVQMKDVIARLFGINMKTFPVEEVEGKKDFATKQEGGLMGIQRRKIKDALDSVLLNKNATQAEKAKARRVFDDAMLELGKKTEEGIPIFGR